MIEIVESELPIEAVSQAVSDELGGGMGALATFVGTVRDNAQGHSILHLEYTAYKPMAEAEMRRIANEVRERWGVPCAMAHRIGLLEVGQASIVVAVAAPHRKEAFAACWWAVDEVKARVPIWKKEVSTSGFWWVEDPVNSSTNSD
ncbi:MAG TPA: molybdenum cofactor biosynthesis protein MoaE [Abditibacteriaceae bacterium]|jgi:molybdopterin synthase catalytic subunit